MKSLDRHLAEEEANETAHEKFQESPAYADAFDAWMEDQLEDDDDGR